MKNKKHFLGILLIAFFIFFGARTNHASAESQTVDEVFETASEVYEEQSSIREEAFEKVEEYSDDELRHIVNHLGDKEELTAEEKEVLQAAKDENFYRVSGLTRSESVTALLFLFVLSLLMFLMFPLVL